MHITHALGRSLPGRWRLTVATLIVAVCITLAVAISGSALAVAAPPPSWTDYQHDPFACSQIESSTEGRIKRVYQGGGKYTRQLQLSTKTHYGPNGQWIVGCATSVYIDVIASNGDILDTTPEQEVTVGAFWDPAGNNKNYSWVNNLEIDDEDLDTIVDVNIRHVPH